MLRRDIAKALGVSEVNLKRSCRHVRFCAQNGKYFNNLALVQQVTDFYSEYGWKATEWAFPDIKIKSILHRDKYYGVSRKPRQIRWTDSQLIELARMSGLVSLTAQAKFFNRPGANAGSIKSVWSKKFNLAPGMINGMTYFLAKDLVDSSAQFLHPKGHSRRGESFDFRWLVLWVDMERSLKPEIPVFIKEAIATLADFQRWLHGKNAKQNILNMIQERELKGAS